MNLHKTIFPYAGPNILILMGNFHGTRSLYGVALSNLT